MSSIRKTRILKELANGFGFGSGSGQEGIKFISEENLETLKFEIIGPDGTPFANETLKLEMKLTNRYPLEPPILRFTTPVRHPNIDEVSGRICLDLLRMPPEGSWRPNVSLGSVLVSVHVLLGAPNLDDPVRPDLISEWQKTKLACDIDENVGVNADVKVKDDENTKPTCDDENNTNSVGKRNFSLSLSAMRKKSKTDQGRDRLFLTILAYGKTGRITEEDFANWKPSAS